MVLIFPFQRFFRRLKILASQASMGVLGEVGENLAMRQLLRRLGLRKINKECVQFCSLKEISLQSYFLQLQKIRHSTLCRTSCRRFGGGALKARSKSCASNSWSSSLSRIASSIAVSFASITLEVKCSRSCKVAEGTQSVALGCHVERKVSCRTAG